MDQTINANLAKCIQQVDHFGYTTYHNICSGTYVDLAWGFGGWAAFAGILLVGVFFIILFAVLAKVLLTEI